MFYSGVELKKCHQEAKILLSAKRNYCEVLSVRFPPSHAVFIMLRQFIRGRVYVFIDAANVLYSQQSLGWRVDYAKLKLYFESECNLRGISFYTGHVGDNTKQRSFLRKLNSLGYHVHSKEVKKIRVSYDTFVLKGNLDVELAIDAVLEFEHYDTMLLVSGDSDFAYLLDVARRCGKSVIVLSARGHVSRELLERAKYVDLQKLRQFIEFFAGRQPKNHPRRAGGGMTES